MLTKNDNTITFDIKISTPKGMVSYTMERVVTRVAGAGTDRGSKLSIVTEMHDKLGHVYFEDIARRTAKAMIGWTLTVGGRKPRKACAAVKKKQKNVPKEKITRRSERKQ